MVDSNLILASWLSRLLASVLDVFLGWATLGVSVLLWFLPAGHLWLAGILGFAGYWALFMALLGRGLTPGKLLVGIRAVREDGSDLGWGLGFMREVVVKRVLGSVLWLFAGLYPVADGLWPLWDPRRQALHDKMVGTLVVRGRSRSSV